MTIKILISKRDLDGLIRMRDGPTAQLAAGQSSSPSLFGNSAPRILGTPLQVQYQAPTDSLGLLRGPAEGEARPQQTTKSLELLIHTPTQSTQSRPVQTEAQTPKRDIRNPSQSHLHPPLPPPVLPTWPLHLGADLLT